MGGEGLHHPRHVGCGLREPAFVLGVGPGSQFTQEGVGGGAGLLGGDTVLGRFGGLAHLGGGLIENPHRHLLWCW